MVDSRDILLKLVRIAMGWENDYTLPADVDWSQVLDIASEQGVDAIALDGYEILAQKNSALKGGLNSPENKRILLQAIGQVPIIEATYKQHIAALKELSEMLSNSGIPFLLMKGLACGRYYPNPSHRLCGDIDIYPGDLFEESNKVLKDKGVDVDPYYYRHSASTIKGVMVENHKVLCDLRGPRKQTRALEAQLETEGKRSISEGDDIVLDGKVVTGTKAPLADFNALFLPWHVSAHFMFERVTIRHLLDWALFLVNEGKKIDVGKFRIAKRNYTYGYGKFADILTDLSMRHLKMPVGDIPLGIIEDAVNYDANLSDKVFNYMFEGQPRERDENVWKFRWNNVKRVWKERWKYKELYNVSVLGFFYHKVMGVIFKVGE